MLCLGQTPPFFHYPFYSTNSSLFLSYFFLDSESINLLFWSFFGYSCKWFCWMYFCLISLTYFGHSLDINKFILSYLIKCILNLNFAVICRKLFIITILLIIVSSRQWCQIGGDMIKTLKCLECHSHWKHCLCDNHCLRSYKPL